MVTDPIADFLIRLRNALMANKESVVVPSSKMTLALSEVLSREGYIGAVDKKVKNNSLTIALTYKNGRPSILGSKRISKPSRRMYIGVHDVKPVKRGHGLLVLSTPAGILTGKEAKEKHVGGEALFEIW
ncbi:MAG TPA: 30S ribosomal protein S8 [Candidatus Paceibacterota bacterium]|nr:30S ribosomal protein S8 [Candidatus Paceibacterota bacterium]